MELLTMILLVLSLTGSRAIYPDSRVDFIWIHSTTPIPINGNEMLGVPFTTGTEVTWCNRAIQQLAPGQTVEGEIRFAAFNVKEMDFGVGANQYILNMLECPITPYPLYVHRYSRNGYQFYFYFPDEPSPKKSPKKEKMIYVLDWLKDYQAKKRAAQTKGETSC